MKALTLGLGILSAAISWPASAQFFPAHPIQFVVPYPPGGTSLRTPAILAESGLKYVLDWPNDEQPYRMNTNSGPLLSVPLAIDFDDVFAHWQRKISMDRWVRSIREALDQLEIDGRSNGRMLVLNLHPWLIGQPWRVTFLHEVLKDLVSRRNIWLTTTDQIAEWADEHLP